MECTGGDTFTLWRAVAADKYCFAVLMHFCFANLLGKLCVSLILLYSFLLSFAFFFVRKINNKVYCIAFLCAFVLTTAAIGFLRKKDVECIYESGVKEGIQKALPVLLYWFITVVNFYAK